MPIGLLFWIIMIIWIITGLAGRRPGSPPWLVWGGDLVLCILIFLLGWHNFGFIIHN
jgi:hypothetical protein